MVTATVRPYISRKISRKIAPAKPTEPEVVQVRDMPDMVAKPLPKPEPLTPFKIGDAIKPDGGYRLVRTASFEPDPIEPKRKRRITRERDPIEARLDLHGLNQIAAEARLKAFVQQAYANDYRAILVITGKGMAENGILKRNAPEWLADPAMSYMVAGISQAHTRHGGSGALYVALKKRQR
nr:Smr/MutS family protein [Asticcacaulis machinosus]